MVGKDEALVCIALHPHAVHSLSQEMQSKGGKMSLDKPSAEELDKILDLIHDIAAEAAGEDEIPPKVDDALDRIIALSRYKFDVTNEKAKR